MMGALDLSAAGATAELRRARLHNAWMLVREAVQIRMLLSAGLGEPEAQRIYDAAKLGAVVSEEPPAALVVRMRQALERAVASTVPRREGKPYRRVTFQ